MKKLLMVLVFNWLLIAIANAQQGMEGVKLTPQALRANVHMIIGAGGNIGVSAGQDGILIIDDQFAPLADKIQQTLADINPAPLRYIINTHHHGDHTGSNAALNKNNSVTIVAHHNVRTRLKKQNFSKGHAHLPVLTYDQGIRFHFNNDTIELIHFGRGHTDGDSVVVFKHANVVHTGDHFFKDRFPFIDLKHGGDVMGYLNNVNKMIDMVDPQTILIPGHGSVANKQDLVRFRDMISATMAHVAKAKAAGNSLEQIVADGLGEQWLSWRWQFISEERWITTLYQGQ